MPRVTAAQRLDRLPVGRFHRRILILIGAGMFLDNFDATLQGGVLGALNASHWSTLGSNAQFISATFVGMLIGSFLAGVLGDRYGRRFAYQINLLIIGVTSLAAAAAAAPSMRWLIGFRLIMGLGLGAELVIGYSTLTEFVPPKLRGRWMAGIEAEVREPLPPFIPAGSVEASPTTANLRVLFSKPVIMRTFLGSLTTVTANVVLYGFLSWLPTFLVIQRLGISASLRYTMIMSLGAPLGPLVASFISDRVGRRASLAITSVFAAALGGAYAMVSTIGAATAVGFFLFLAMYLLATLGLASYVPELFPTAYRLRGAGVCMTAGRAAGAVVPYFTAWAYPRGGVALILEVFCGLLLFQALVILLFGIRTENRSLEELIPDAGTLMIIESNVVGA